MGRWVYPLDDDCPAVIKFMQLADDPLMRESGCFGEFYEDFAKSHRVKCLRCQEYGAANVDVEY